MAIEGQGEQKDAWVVVVARLKAKYFLRSKENVPFRTYKVQSVNNKKIKFQ